MFYMLLVTLLLIALSRMFMTAPAAYQEASVTWKSAAILGIVDCTESETVEGTTSHRTDNAIATMANFLDGAGAEISVSTTLVSLRGTTGFTLGSNGALVVVLQARAEGVGAVGGANKTHTYGDATLVSMEHGVPINGKATLVLKFRVADPAGLAVCVYS